MQRKAYMKQIKKRIGEKRTITKIKKALELLERSKFTLRSLKPEQLIYTYEKKPSHKQAPILTEFYGAIQQLTAYLEEMKQAIELKTCLGKKPSKKQKT